MSQLLQSHIGLLGLTVTDKVTGFKGVVTCVSFDLFGCIQAVVQPPSVDISGKPEIPESRWFDVSRLSVGDRKMDVPFHFANDVEPVVEDGTKGACDKPAGRFA